MITFGSLVIEQMRLIQTPPKLNILPLFSHCCGIKVVPAG